MNLITRLSLFLILISFLSCSPKIHPVFQKQSEFYYSHSWKKLDSYPIDSGRNDDLFFFTPDRGFVISSWGKLLLTEDGGKTWEVKFEKEEKSFFRCLTFRDEQHGWLGTIGPGATGLTSRDTISMYATKDGGDNWTPVEFDGPYPKGLCGLQTVSDKVIVGCGRVRGPSYFIKSTDGGETWKSYDMNHIAGSLIAPYFYDEMHGILVGGTTQDKKNSRSLVLETFDGGATWDTLHLSEQIGEYPWKVSFPTEKRGFISIQRNVRDGEFYVLQTEDGGKTWFENEYVDSYFYVQGIGFLNDQVGWMGGSPSHTVETRDGGKTWLPMADVGRGFNKFQFFEDGSGYGTGYGVFKMEFLRPLPDGEVLSVDKNDHSNSKISYRKGKQYGPAEFFHSNGKIAEKGKLKSNLRHGTWRFFDEKGGLQKKLKYQNGMAKISKPAMMDFVGKYQIREDAFRTITMTEEGLYSQHSNAEKGFHIYPISAQEFIIDDGRGTLLEFVRDASGQVTHQILKTKRKEVKAVRL